MSFRKPMSFTGVLFSPQGRISRSQFWFGQLALIAIPIAFILMLVGSYQALDSLFGLAQPIEGTDIAFLPEWVGSIVAVLVVGGYFLLIYCSVVVSVKRLHDRDKSGWWYLLMVLLSMLIVGFFWWLFELGFMEGTDGPNTFGPDPHAMIEDRSSAGRAD